MSHQTQAAELATATVALRRAADIRAAFRAATPPHEAAAARFTAAALGGQDLATPLSDTVEQLWGLADLLQAAATDVAAHGAAHPVTAAALAFARTLNVATELTAHPVPKDYQ